MIFSVYFIWHYVIPDLIYSAKTAMITDKGCAALRNGFVEFLCQFGIAARCWDLWPGSITFSGNGAWQGAARVMIRPKVLYPNLTQQISVSLQALIYYVLRCYNMVELSFVRVCQDFYVVFLYRWTFSNRFYMHGDHTIFIRVQKWFPGIKEYWPGHDRRDRGHKDQQDDQRCCLLSCLVVLTLRLHTNDQGRNLSVDGHRIRIQWPLLPEDDLQLCQRSAPNQSWALLHQSFPLHPKAPYTVLQCSRQ